MKGMKVKDVMSSPVHVIALEDTIAHARRLMLRHGISRLVVVDKEKPVGVVTKSDLMWKLRQAGPMWRRRQIDRTPIKVVMSENPVTTYPDALLEETEELMLENNIGGLPVVDDGLIGMVSKFDIVRQFSNTVSRVKVGDIIGDFVVTVHRHSSINHVIDEMQENDVHRVVVMEDDDTPVGIITSSNLAFIESETEKGEMPEKKIKMTRKDSPAGRKRFRDIEKKGLVAEDVMSSPLITVDKNEFVVNAAKMLIGHKIEGMPVVDGRLVGVISKTDIIRMLHSVATA